MFGRTKCIHKYKFIGKFYKEHLTEYRNAFDTIKVYEKYKCDVCGNIKDVLLSSESFVLELYEGRCERKDRYIKYLRDKNIVLEIELFL